MTGKRTGMFKKCVKYAIIGLVLIFMYVPILILAVYSFTDSPNIGAIHSFSFHNYVTLFTTPELIDMIIGSIALAIGSAVLATILGTTGAIGAFNSKKNVVIGHTVLSEPFVYLAVVPKLKQMDPSLYEAALDLGATPGYTLIHIIIPQIASGIVSGFVMAVTLSLDDYFVATYTKPATFDTISTYVVNATKGSQTNIKTALWALSTIIFLIVVIVEVVMNFAPIKNEAQKEKH